MRYLTQKPIPSNRQTESFSPKDGASVQFLGVVREKEANASIQELEYESYGPMAEEIIAQLVTEAKERWPIHHVEVLHRIGRVQVGEISVVIRVQTPHREEAFAACRFLIDKIKAEAPIWKRVWFKDENKNIPRREDLILHC